MADEVKAQASNSSGKNPERSKGVWGAIAGQFLDIQFTNPFTGTVHNLLNTVPRFGDLFKRFFYKPVTSKSFNHNGPIDINEVIDALATVLNTTFYGFNKLTRGLKKGTEKATDIGKMGNVGPASTTVNNMDTAEFAKMCKSCKVKMHNAKSPTNYKEAYWTIIEPTQGGKTEYQKRFGVSDKIMLIYWNDIVKENARGFNTGMESLLGALRFDSNPDSWLLKSSNRPIETTGNDSDKKNDDKSKNSDKKDSEDKDKDDEYLKIRRMKNRMSLGLAGGSGEFSYDAMTVDNILQAKKLGAKYIVVLRDYFTEVFDYETFMDSEENDSGLADKENPNHKVISESFNDEEYFVEADEPTSIDAAITGADEGSVAEKAKKFINELENIEKRIGIEDIDVKKEEKDQEKDKILDELFNEIKRNGEDSKEGKQLIELEQKIMKLYKEVFEKLNDYNNTSVEKKATDLLSKIQKELGNENTDLDDLDNRREHIISELNSKLEKSRTNKERKTLADLKDKLNGAANNIKNEKNKREKRKSETKIQSKNAAIQEIKDNFSKYEKENFNEVKTTKLIGIVRTINTADKIIDDGVFDENQKELINKIWNKVFTTVDHHRRNVTSSLSDDQIKNRITLFDEMLNSSRKTPQYLKKVRDEHYNSLKLREKKGTKDPETVDQHKKNIEIIKDFERDRSWDSNNNPEELRKKLEQYNMMLNHPDFNDLEDEIRKRINYANDKLFEIGNRQQYDTNNKLWERIGKMNITNEVLYAICDIRGMEKTMKDEDVLSGKKLASKKENIKSGDDFQLGLTYSGEKPSEKKSTEEKPKSSLRHHFTRKSKDMTEISKKDLDTARGE